VSGKADTAPCASSPRLDDQGHLIVPPLDAKQVTDPSVGHHDITSRMPQIDLAEVLAEMDQHVGLTDFFTHAAGQTNRMPELRVHLFAAMLAHGCNLGVNHTARISGLSSEQLRWVSTWYLRHDTLTEANDAIVNFHHAQPVSALWGDRTLSSSDGQRFAVGVQTPVARYQRKYFVDKARRSTAGHRTGTRQYRWRVRQRHSGAPCPRRECLKGPLLYLCHVAERSIRYLPGSLRSCIAGVRLLRWCRAWRLLLPRSGVRFVRG